MTNARTLSAQRKSNALVITAGSLMNDPQVHHWMKRQFSPDDLGGFDIYAVDTTTVEHVQPSNRLRVSLDVETRRRLRMGTDIPTVLERVHLAGAAGGIDGNGATSGLAVTEALHLLARDFVSPQLERIHADLLGRARPEDGELVIYLVLSTASNTGRGSLIPLAVSAARLRDRLVQAGKDALLVGVVLLPGRVDGSGATMRERFEAQGAACMRELFALESAVRDYTVENAYHLGGVPARVDRCLFDYIVPVSSSRLAPADLATRAAALTGYLLADAAGVGARLRTDRVRLTAGDINDPGPRLSPVGYGGVFLDHPALLEKASLQIRVELFERVCAPSTDDAAEQFLDGDAESWFEEIAEEAFPREEVQAPVARSDAPADKEQALEDTRAAAEQVEAVLSRRAAQLEAALKLRLDSRIDEYLASARPLKDFPDQLNAALELLSEVADQWAESSAPEAPILGGDLPAVNADVRQYAEQLTDYVWAANAADVLRRVVRHFRGSVMRNVEAVIRALETELDERVMSTRVRLQCFDQAAKRNDVPGLINLWSAPGAYDRFFRDNHPYRDELTEGETTIDDERLSRFLRPVRDDLISAFREGRALEFAASIRRATMLYFEPELERVQVGHFLKQYGRDSEWIGQMLSRAIAESEPLVELRPTSGGRERIIYVEVPDMDPAGDELYEMVCGKIDSPRVRPLKVAANRPLPAILVMQVVPNLPYTELQLLADYGSAMEAYERYEQQWRTNPAYPLFTDRQLKNLVDRQFSAPTAAAIATPDALRHHTVRPEAQEIAISRNGHGRLEQNGHSAGIAPGN